MGRFDGKVAIVTGAGRGQGEAEARMLAAEGATVVLGDVLDDEGAAIAADIGGNATYVHLDVSNEADWATAIAAAARASASYQVLVNNAGIIRPAAIEDTSLDDYLSRHPREPGRLLPRHEGGARPDARARRRRDREHLVDRRHEGRQRARLVQRVEVGRPRA